MELTSPHWGFDPTTLEIDPKIGALCDFRVDLYDETNLQALQAGLWWVYPLGRTYASHLIGLRLRPGTPLAQSPVVVTSGAEAVTLSSRPAAFVAARIFAQMVGGEPRWSEVAQMPAATRASAIELHHALGGEDDLQTLRSVATDRVLAASFCDRDEHPGWYSRWVGALAEAHTRLDPIPETTAYYRYAAAVAAAHSTATPPPEAGCWNPTLAALAFCASRRDGAHEAARELKLEAAWQMGHHPPALDTSRIGTAMTIEPGSDLSVELGVDAAAVVLNRPRPAWADSPWLPAIQAATAEDYDGTAHIDAAQALAHAGDAAGAFDALTAAAFWSYHASGVARPDALDAAILVARQARSHDIADALEQQRHAYTQLQSA